MSDYSDYDASFRAKVAKNEPETTAGCYTGPIELIKPGDILHWTRFEEYREFMRTKKNVASVKLWGVNENWEDNHQRPFQLDIKPEVQVGDKTTNPFE